MPRALYYRPKIDLRISIFAILMLLFLGVLLARLWWLEVAKGADYAQQIANGSEVTVRIPSVRGEIRDCNGIPLVTNRASYDVDFYLPDMVRGYRERFGQPPMLAHEAKGRHGLLQKRPEVDVAQIVDSTVTPRLEELKLSSDYDAEQLQRHWRDDTEVPFTYMEDINFPTMAEFSEHDLGLPGVDITARPVRHYVYGAFAAHILGYVGLPHDLSTEPDINDYNFYQPDVDGKSNIEKAMDHYLRGKPGVRIMHRNTKRIIDGEVRVDPPIAGDNVYLTIDARIQMIAEEALRQPLIGRAAAVVVDPNNGDILAMASVPSFDPNQFIPSISSKDFAVLNDNPASPLVNRAMSYFAPGSTFKVVTALAGLFKGEAKARFNCPGSIVYGDHVFHCWKASGHGTLDLSDAIKASCDVFFYQYGNAAGIDNIARAGKLLGIGEPSDLPLSSGRLPPMPGSPAFIARYPKERTHSQAFIANVSIGQGYVSASPLQMAMVYATFANGGICYDPRLIKKVMTPDGVQAINDDGTPAVSPTLRIRADLRKLLPASEIEEVRRGLWKVVNADGGTGARARIKGVEVAGKTGTADSSDGKGHHETIAWFCCFAPYDHPKYVIAVMVEGGKHGGSVGTPIATHILQQCLAMDSGDYKPKLKVLAPAQNPHPFNVIMAVSYNEKTSEIAPSAENDDDDAHTGSARIPSQLENESARPDIRPAPANRHRVRRAEIVKPARPAQSRPTPKPRNTRNIFERFFNPHPSKPNGQ